MGLQTSLNRGHASGRNSADHLSVTPSGTIVSPGSTSKALLASNRAYSGLILRPLAGSCSGLSSGWRYRIPVPSRAGPECSASGRSRICIRHGWLSFLLLSQFRDCPGRRPAQTATAGNRILITQKGPRLAPYDRTHVSRESIASGPPLSPPVWPYGRRRELCIEQTCKFSIPCFCL
jgi:hypothetical protein